MEVELIQYVRPSGRARLVVADLPDNEARLAASMDLSCEQLSDGQVVVYARMKSAPADKEVTRLAANGPGPHSPDKMLCEAIRECAEQSEKKEG